MQNSSYGSKADVWVAGHLAGAFFASAIVAFLVAKQTGRRLHHPISSHPPPPSPPTAKHCPTFSLINVRQEKHGHIYISKRSIL